MWRSPSHGTNNGRASEPQAVPPCKPPPSRPPVTPSIDEVSSGFHGVGNNNVNNSNNNNSSTGTPTNVPNSNSSHNLATPTARQTKPVRMIFRSNIDIVDFISEKSPFSPNKFVHLPRYDILMNYCITLLFIKDVQKCNHACFECKNFVKSKIWKKRYLVYRIEKRIFNNGKFKWNLKEIQI